MKPKYKYQDKVMIYVKEYPKETVPPINDGVDNGAPVIKTKKLYGEIYIIDRNGTWDNLNKEPSYDVFVESNNTLYKHITESSVYPDDRISEINVINGEK